MTGRHRACAVGLLAMVGACATEARQRPTAEPPAAWVAFRLDAAHVVAVLRVLETQGPQPSAPHATPLARYGFTIGGAAPSVADEARLPVVGGDSWLVHAAPGRVVPATAVRLVAGDTGCQSAVGALLRVPADADALAATRGRNYFLATRGRATAPASASTLGPVTTPASRQFRAAVERQLDALLRDALPQVRQDAADEIARMARSAVEYHRAWAGPWPGIDAALDRGEARRRDDVQSYRLTAGDPPVHFVRAEWLADGHQAFAASVWLRGIDQLEVVDRWLTPASWLRMFEFQGKIGREQLGLVLGVYDHDADGRAEVLDAIGGYEAMHLRVRRYDGGGFSDTGIGYTYGC